MFTWVYGLPDLPLTSLCIGSYWFTQVYPAWFPVFPVRLGGCPALALRALQVAEGATQLEEAVALIAKEQEAHDVSHGQLAHCWYKCCTCIHIIQYTLVLLASCKANAAFWLRFGNASYKYLNMLMCSQKLPSFNGRPSFE